MELSEALAHVGERAWFRDPRLPGLAPVQVQICSTSSATVRVVQVDDIEPTGAVPALFVFSAAPEDLHFERSAFT